MIRKIIFSFASKKFNLESYLSKNSVKINNYSEANLPLSLIGIRDQVVKSKQSDNYVLSPEDLQKQHSTFLSLFTQYVKGLQGIPAYEDWMDINLYLRTVKSINLLLTNGYLISVQEDDLPTQMQTIEVHTYRGITMNRLENFTDTNYKLDEYAGYTKMIPKTWVSTRDGIDYASLRERQRQLVLRVQVQIHSPLSVRIKSQNGQVSEPLTNIHSVVYENELLRAPKFSEGNDLSEWLALHKLGEWKLINVDCGFNDWPLVLKDNQFSDLKKQIISGSG